MKPRLRVAPLVADDYVAWMFRRRRNVFFSDRLIRASIESDRRDADLMLFFMTLECRATTSRAYLYLWLQQAVDDPANWRTVLVKNPDGTFTEPS